MSDENEPKASHPLSPSLSPSAAEEEAEELDRIFEDLSGGDPELMEILHANRAEWMVARGAPTPSIEVDIVVSATTIAALAAKAERRELAKPDHAPESATEPKGPHTSRTIFALTKSPFADGPHTHARASGVLEWVGTMVPKRINSEEIGDALEGINRLVAEGQPSWFIYLMVAKVFFWVSVHTAWFPMEQFLGILVRIATGRGDDRR